MKVGLAQLNQISADLEGNVQRIVVACERARALGADLVVCPEMSVPGAATRDILFDASFIDAVAEANRDLAAHVAPELVLIVGSVARGSRPSSRHPGLLNAALVMFRGRTQLSVAKRDLRSDAAFFEARWFEPGPPAPRVELRGRVVEVRVGSHVTEKPASAGVDVITSLAASPYEVGEFERRVEAARRARGTVVQVNACGANDGVILGGRSFVLNSAGDLCAVLPPDRAEVLVVDAQTDGACESAAGCTMDELIGMLVVGVRDFVGKNRLGPAVVGLSGGVDSSVVACLAVRALGREGVIGVAMPSRYTDARSTEAAAELAGRLGIDCEVVPIEPLHKAAEGCLGPRAGGGVAAENLQARLRMMILMAVVDSRRGFLLNTSNKTELALGYGTAYGDLAGILSPIGDLDKLQVVELGRHIAETAGEIPAFVLERKPSAELRANQVDPFDYQVIVPEVNRLISGHQSNAAMRSSEHKRRQAGVVLEVSRNAFGSGRLVPITRR